LAAHMSIKKIIRVLLENHYPYVLLKYYLWSKGEYETEINLLPMLIQKNKITIDIGANIGLYAFHLLKYADHVLAFEPNPYISKRLKNTFGNRITVESVALSDHDGEAIFYLPVEKNEKVHMLGTIDRNNIITQKNDNIKITVPIKKLDDYNLSEVGFIKIDVEGHELAVLKGAVKTLTRDKPNLLMEIEERHKKGKIEEIKQFLCALGYQGYFYLNNKLISIDKFDISRYQIPEARFTNETYINNFIFIQPVTRSLLRDLLLC
jgi:FkbM family methyltransferase